MKKPKIDPNKPSILTDDMKHCYLCGSPYQIEWHHILSNSNRNKSTLYKLIVPLCRNCHREVHSNYQKMEALRIKGQEAFEREYPDKDFLAIFHRRYK